MIRYEIKKLLGKASSKIALLLLVALMLMLVYSTIFDEYTDIYWYNEQDQMEIGFAAAQKLKDAQKEWAGTLDQEMLQEALQFLKQNDYNGRQGAKQIRELLNCSYQNNYVYEYGDYYNAEKIQPEELSQFYQNRTKLIQKWLYDDTDSYNNGFYNYTDKEKEFIVERIETLETPFQIDYVLGWEVTSGVVGSFAIFGIIILGYLLSGIFSNETRWKTDAVLYSTLHGRENTAKAKVKAGFILTTVLYWGITLAVSLLLLIGLGFDGANCPIQIVRDYWFSIYNLTFLQKYLLILVSCYIGWLFVAALVMFISAKSKSIIFPVIIPTLLIIFPLTISNDNVFVEKLISLLPSALFSLGGINLEELTVYTIFGKVVTPVPLVLFLYSGMTILLAWISYRTYRKKSNDMN